MPPYANSAGAASKPIIEPLWKPPMETATARERSVTGTHREMTLFMHGSATPSPNPMTARAASNAPKLPLVATKGVTNVASDHTAIPNPRTIFPPYLSASTPPMSGVRAYPHRNELCTKPTARSPQPFAAAKGTPATDMITLSALHSMSANATIPTTTNRYALALASSLDAIVAPSAAASTLVPSLSVEASPRPLSLPSSTHRPSTTRASPFALASSPPNVSPPLAVDHRVDVVVTIIFFIIIILLVVVVVVVVIALFTDTDATIVVIGRTLRRPVGPTTTARARASIARRDPRPRARRSTDRPLDRAHRDRSRPIEMIDRDDRSTDRDDRSR